MKILYNWLAEYIDIDITPQELAEVFTKLGIEVEDFTFLGEGKDTIKTGVITDIKDHPNSSHLKIVSVKTLERDVQVISGAPNIKKGSFVFVAFPGTLIKGDTIIKERNIRGIVSEGNLLSLYELGLEEHSDGIFVPVGVSLEDSPIEYLGLSDYLYDLYITPNRPDLLSVMGIAIEIAAYLNKKIELPRYGVREGLSEMFPTEIKNTEACPRYTSRIIRNVKIGESPFYMKRKLYLCGMRPINNIVDITNYTMLEVGHPLHAFDLNKLEDSIVVRTAYPDEIINALDGEEYALLPDTLVIADRKRALAIAGIIGGAEYSIGENTENILLESAYFAPQVVARTMYSLGLRTESAMRFSKGMDYKMTLFASQRAAYLVNKISPDAEVSRINDTNYIKDKENRIFVSYEKVNRVIGAQVDIGEIEDIVKRLGFTVMEKDDEKLDISVPTRRQDIKMQEDVIEEILRFKGFDFIQPSVKTSFGVVGKREDKVSGYIRDIMLSQGYYEARNVEFIDAKGISMWNTQKTAAFEIENPLSPEYRFVRNSLLPGLLRAARNNFRYGIKGIKMFELGKIYLAGQDKSEEVVEESHLAAVSGGFIQKSWYNEERKLDFYDISGAFQLLMEKLGIEVIHSEPYSTDSFSYAIDIEVDSRKIGTIGQVSSSLLRELGVKQDMFFFEMDIKNIKLPVIKYREIPRFPAIRRDISIVVEENATYAQIVSLFKKQSLKYMQSVQLIDIYKGKQFKPGKVSMTFNITFYRKDGTLRKEEVDREVERMFKTLKDIGYEPRI